MTDEELEQLKNEVTEKQLVNTTNQDTAIANVPTDDSLQNKARSLVTEQQDKDISEYKENDDFKSASKKLAKQQVLGEFKARTLEVLKGDIANQYQEYLLKKEKERLDYIAEKEKPLIKEQAKADLMAQKQKIAEQRYGYLYQRIIIKDINDEGKEIQKVIYKDFTPSKPLNVLKELTSKYKNLSQTTRSAIWTTLKIIFGIGLAVLVVWLGYKGISALFNSGFIQINS